MRRVFLFLQGPPGPFFAQLGEALRQRGHGVRRILFNGGDRIDWRGAADSYRGAPAAWPAAIAAILAKDGITDLVLFGDCRPLHRVAIAAARRHGVEIHVFEEGYVRPDFVTIERDGVNGHSRLPRDPAYYLAEAVGLPAIEHRAPIAASFAWRARETLMHYLASWAMTPLYPRYRGHRPFSRASELLGWARRLAVRPLARRRSAAVRARLRDAGYFILPLQLESDYQLRIHADVGGMATALEAIIASFARAAPADRWLVVKEHPLDNGLRDWRRLVATIAAAHGIAARVQYLEVADIDALVRGAVGVVTVNSTTGTLALRAGVPVKVLGRAVYDLPGVTDQGALDHFWVAPAPPQGEIFEAFRRVLARRCLVWGGFSSAAGRAALIAPAVERLLAPRPVAWAGAPAVRTAVA